jgi:hypothetical protein
MARLTDPAADGAYGVGVRGAVSADPADAQKAVFTPTDADADADAGGAAFAFTPRAVAAAKL